MECGEIIKQYLLSLLTVFRKKIRGQKYTLSQQYEKHMFDISEARRVHIKNMQNNT